MIRPTGPAGHAICSYIDSNMRSHCLRMRNFDRYSRVPWTNS